MTEHPLPGPVVSTSWLAAHLGEPGLVVVDGSWYLPAAGRDPRAEYRAGHIPGAVFWDLDALSDRGTALPHMLPPPGDLAREIGALGVGDGDRVVAYDGSGTNLSAPRIWWTLRVARQRPIPPSSTAAASWPATRRVHQIRGALRLVPEPS